MYEAGKGDCFLIEGFEETLSNGEWVVNNQSAILIDGGVSGTFKNMQNDTDFPKNLDLVIVTHYDDDHINGILDLFDSIIAQEGVCDNVE